MIRSPSKLPVVTLDHEKSKAYFIPISGACIQPLTLKEHNQE